MQNVGQYSSGYIKPWFHPGCPVPPFSDPPFSLSPPFSRLSNSLPLERISRQPHCHVKEKYTIRQNYYGNELCQMTIFQYFLMLMFKTIFLVAKSPGSPFYIPNPHFTRSTLFEICRAPAPFRNRSQNIWLKPCLPWFCRAPPP